MFWAADSIKNKSEKDTLYEEMLLGRGLNIRNPTKREKTKNKTKRGLENNENYTQKNNL